MPGLTIDNPVTLEAALASDRILPGDVLALRAGTYTKDRWILPENISGTPEHWITIKPYNNERVCIDGELMIFGSYIRVIGLESINTRWTGREFSNSIVTVGFDCLGNFNEIINCHISNHHQGITTSAVRTGHVYYGNVIAFNGWYGNGGHGIYPQNNAGNTKTIKRNIFADNFGYGIHCYGAGGAISDFVIDGNTAFESGAPKNLSELATNILNGGSSGLSGLRMSNNMTYIHPGVHGGRVQVGYGVGNLATDIQVWDNYFAAPEWSMVFVSADLTRFDGNYILGWTEGIIPGDWPANTYVSTYPQVTPYPTEGNHIVVTDNEYDANRAQLTVYNWDLADTVAVDISSLGWTGQVRARNVQDYWIDVQTLDIVGGSITMNMQAINRTVATPVAWTPSPPTTFPQFGAFVLEKV